MKIKKFCASNNQEALNLVKNELGPDAVILYQRKIKPKGLLGFLKKPIIEVVAAKEDNIFNKPQNLNNDYESPVQLLQKKLQYNNKKDEISITSIDKEVQEIKNMLGTVIKKVNQQQLPDSLKSIDNQEIINLFNVLKKQELDDVLIEEIINKCISIYYKAPNSLKDKEILKTEIKKIINKYIILQDRSINSQIMFFIGPTGVGKTTTIAKLAAQYSLNEGKSIGLISADTYRIAAVEQLKTYCDILNIPLEIIYNPSEIHYAINNLKEKDIIMVDTAGRSHKDKKQVLELQKLLNEIDEKEVFLVISCTSKEITIKEIIDTYSFIDSYNIIFTKIDEATSFGTILNTAKETKKPISYITTGQSVPDDIETINIEKIVSLLLKEALR